MESYGNGMVAGGQTGLRVEGRGFDTALGQVS